MYRTVIAAVAVWMAASSQSMAGDMVFAREALSGQPKAVWVYRSWTSNCQETGGVTKVIGKPQHGRLSKQRVVKPVGFNRYNPSDHCIGKVIPGLQVIYTSAPGYRGSDRFVIERTLGDGRVDVETFIMTVR